MAYLLLGGALPHPQHKNSQVGRHGIRHLVEQPKDGVALLQLVLQIPRVVHPAVRLRVHAERRFDRDAKVVPGAADRPKQIRVELLRGRDG